MTAKVDAGVYLMCIFLLHWILSLRVVGAIPLLTSSRPSQKAILLCRHSRANDHIMQPKSLLLNLIVGSAIISFLISLLTQDATNFLEKCIPFVLWRIVFVVGTTTVVILLYSLIEVRDQRKRKRRETKKQKATCACNGTGPLPDSNGTTPLPECNGTAPLSLLDSNGTALQPLQDPNSRALQPLQDSNSRAPSSLQNSNGVATPLLQDSNGTGSPTRLVHLESTLATAPEDGKDLHPQGILATNPEQEQEHLHPEETTALVPREDTQHSALQDNSTSQGTSTRPRYPELDSVIEDMIDCFTEESAQEFSRDFVAITIPDNNCQPATVEAALGFSVTLPVGSKVVYKWFEVGPQTTKDQLHTLKLQVMESVREAQEIDKNFTLQLGSFAVLKYTDHGPKWWRLQEHPIPTISNIQRSPWNLLDLLTGRSATWIIRGFNLQNAQLKFSNVDEKEVLNILRSYKMESEDVLLCEEPYDLVYNSALLFRKEIYICALHSVEVEDGVIVNLQSNPHRVHNKTYWVSVVQGLIPSQWALLILASLSLHNILTGGINLQGTSFFAHILGKALYKFLMYTFSYFMLVFVLTFWRLTYGQVQRAVTRLILVIRSLRILRNTCISFDLLECDQVSLLGESAHDVPSPRIITSCEGFNNDRRRISPLPDDDNNVNIEEKEGEEVIEEKGSWLEEAKQEEERSCLKEEKQEEVQEGSWLEEHKKEEEGSRLEEGKQEEEEEGLWLEELEQEDEDEEGSYLEEKEEGSWLEQDKQEEGDDVADRQTGIPAEDLNHPHSHSPPLSDGYEVVEMDVDAEEKQEEEGITTEAGIRAVAKAIKLGHLPALESLGLFPRRTANERDRFMRQEEAGWKRNLTHHTDYTEVVTLVVGNDRKCKAHIAQTLAKARGATKDVRTKAGVRIFTKKSFPSAPVVIDTTPLCTTKDWGRVDTARVWISQNGLRKLFGKHIFVVCVIASTDPNDEINKEPDFACNRFSWLHVLACIFEKHIQQLVMLVNSKDSTDEASRRIRLKEILKRDGFMGRDNITFFNLRTELTATIKSVLRHSDYRDEAEDETTTNNRSAMPRPFLLRYICWNHASDKDKFGPWVPENIILFGKTGSGKSTLAQMLTILFGRTGSGKSTLAQMRTSRKLDAKHKKLSISSSMRGETRRVNVGHGRGWCVIDTPGLGEWVDLPGLGEWVDLDEQSSLSTAKDPELIKTHLQLVEGTYSHFFYVWKKGRLDDVDERLWKEFKRAFDAEIIKHHITVVVSNADPEWFNENNTDLKACFEGCESFVTADFPLSYDDYEDDCDAKKEVENLRLESLEELEGQITSLGRRDTSTAVGMWSKGTQRKDAQRCPAGPITMKPSIRQSPAFGFWRIVERIQEGVRRRNNKTPHDCRGF